MPARWRKSNRGRTTRRIWRHKPGNESMRYEGKLKSGAYLIEAKGGGVSA